MMFFGEKEAHLKYFFKLVFKRTKRKTNVKHKKTYVQFLFITAAAP